MPHLDPERLAALDHDGPSPEELAHLDSCHPCAQERLRFARLATFAHAHGETAHDRAPRLTDWASLSERLRADGLLTRPADLSAEFEGVDAFDSPGAAVAPQLVASSGRASSLRGVAPLPLPRRAMGVRHRWSSAMRSAAALALLAGGVALGRASTGSAILPSRASFAAQTVANDDAFGSVAEASGVLERAQRDYQRASMWLSSHDTTTNAQAVYRARLAALKQMMTASRAGLYEAPQDPVLNQYYLAAYTAREATLRQLSASLPVDRVMESF